MKRLEKIRVVVTALTVALTVCGFASAQGFGMPQLSEEEAAAVHKLQVTSVVTAAEVDKEKVEDIVKAYTEARKSYTDAMQELMSGGGMGGDMQAFTDMRTEQTSKLETKLKELVTEEQLKKIMPVLGSFNMSYDQYTNTLIGFKLEEKKCDEAMKVVNDYVIASDKAFADIDFESGDFQAIMDAMQKVREEMNTAMKKVLDEKQFTEWETATASGFGG